VIGLVLARRYAKALIDLAQEKRVVAEVGEDLAKIAEVFSSESHDLTNVFSDPTVSTQIKGEILESVLEKSKIQKLTLKFLQVLLEKHRILGVKEINQAYMEYADRLANRIRARVVTAVPLDKDEENNVRTALASMSGKEVVVELEVDESLLGGLVAYMGGQVYDGSLSNQLHQVKESLRKGR